MAEFTSTMLREVIQKYIISLIAGGYYQVASSSMINAYLAAEFTGRYEASDATTIIAQEVTNFELLS